MSKVLEVSKNPQELVKLFALFVGDSGDGKSTAAASFPGRFFELDFDHRIRGIQNSMNLGIIKPEKIEYHQFPRRMKTFKPIEEFFSKWEILAATNQFPYSTVGLGSIGSLARTAFNITVGATGYDVQGLKIDAPANYKWESACVHSVLDFLADLPCNVIITGHIIDQWGKAPGANEYSSNVVIREKINLHDNLGSLVEAAFDDVYRFYREDKKDGLKYFVSFAGGMAKNSFGLPAGKFDFTGKSFYEFFLETLKKKKEGTLEIPKVGVSFLG